MSAARKCITSTRGRGRCSSACTEIRPGRSLPAHRAWTPDQFRCIAVDYPGFGFSTAPVGYRYTIAEHARVVEGFIEHLDLCEVTLMVQDWGGPIGFWV